MIEVEQSAEARPAANRTCNRVVILRYLSRGDQLPSKTLMKALDKIMRNKLAEEVSQVTLAEDHEVLETLGANCSHESFRVRTAVQTACWNSHGLHSA
jgi:hypothetical protein